MHNFLFLLFLLVSTGAFSQTLPFNRSVDWTLAGLNDTTTVGFIEIDMQAEGAIGDGITPNDSILENVLLSVLDSGVILNFPEGNFLFNETIHLPNNSVIKGEGAEATTLTMDLNGPGHSFSITGQNVSSTTSEIIDFAPKNDNFIVVADPTIFSEGDWIRILLNDSSLVTSSWAYKTVGQVVQIESITNNKLFLESPLRMDFETVLTPFVVKMKPAKNIGIECLKIHRLDDTSPSQTSNIYYSYAVNCWVNGIESENCTFSHVQARRSSNLHISKSYFHHAFEYGGGGRAYGVMLHITSNECFVENNIFEHLRHSMIVQAGANGNVFAYNYSFDPYWESTPNNSAGDLVLHGNYTFANLFEQNICQNIVIDNSHGPNGPYNTMLRNRAEKYGIFFSSSNSPNQNFLGNEIPNTGLPYSFVNYTIQGSGHFLHGNNNKGSILPAGTDVFMDSSYSYNEKPRFVPEVQWAGIGSSNTMGANSIPAYDRYQSGEIFSNACGDISPLADLNSEDKSEMSIYPNPVSSELTVKSPKFIKQLKIVDVTGKVVDQFDDFGFSSRINTTEWQEGMYFLTIYFNDNQSVTTIVLKSN